MIEHIESLIKTNIELWHNAIQIKTDGKPNRTLPTEERVKIFYKIRELNTLRSDLRWRIDSAIGFGTNETKVNYGANPCNILLGS